MIEIRRIAELLDLHGEKKDAAELVEKGEDWYKKGLIRDSLSGQSTEIFLGESFGEILRGYKKARGLSQRTLALKTGLNHSAVSRLERGLRVPTVSTVLRISEALGLTPEQQEGLIRSVGNSVSKPRFP